MSKRRMNFLYANLFEWLKIYVFLVRIMCRHVIDVINVIIPINWVTTSYMSRLQRDRYPKFIEDTL